MFERVRSWPHKIRATLFFISFVAIWSVWSLPPLIANQPEEFQAAGSIIVAWGILFLIPQRVRHESTIRVAEEIAIVSLIERLEAHRKISDSKTELTFDLHMAQIAQLSKHVGAPNLIGPETDEEIGALSKSIQERTGGRTHMPPPKEDATAQRSLDQLRSIRSNFNPWLKLLWRIELGFMAFGTLQWGYGNQWVGPIHETAGPALSGLIAWITDLAS